MKKPVLFAVTISLFAQTPLVIREQGSFFIGGTNKTVPGGETTVNQMYVQYQIPETANLRVPVVMVHGCCLSSKSWETTPDGRMGWSEYFVRKNHPVYLADQVSRARSGFDVSGPEAVRAGKIPPHQMPDFRIETHEQAWAAFRFGPKFNEPYPDTQFPVAAMDEFYKQLIPDLNSTLSRPKPTPIAMAALAERLKGAVLIGHSESGTFPEDAALANPAGVRGVVTIEDSCGASKPQIEKLAHIPVLVVFGDHLDVGWKSALDSCQYFVNQLKSAGGNAEMLYLPDHGMKGNSHMRMQDKNNLQVADLILQWMDKNARGGQDTGSRK